MLLKQDSHIWNKNSRNLEFINSIRGLNRDDIIKSLENHDLYGIRIQSKEVEKLAMDWYKSKGFTGNNPNDVKMNYYLSEIEKLKVNSVLEIGGGMGKLAEKIIDKGYDYTDIDLEESIFCAKTYLNGKGRLLDLSEVKSLYGKEFDVVINTHSMGEMSNNDVNFWMDFIQDKIKCKYFIGFNRFLNTISDDEYSKFRRNENKASISFDNKWKVMDWELSPVVLNCPYEDTRAARCLKVVLKRLKDKDSYNIDINEILLQDWYRYEPRVGTNLSSPLWFDNGKESTIFKLWNQIRVNPSSKFIELMISYMNFIKRDFDFEEKFAYMEMINEN